MFRIFLKTTFSLLFLLSIIFTQAQNDTTVNVSDDLLNDIESGADSIKLLPDKMLCSQKLFWGKKGFMRNFSKFELTPEKRQKEMKLRRAMLIGHQVFGSITTLGMIGQGITGSKLYDGNSDYRTIHKNLALGVNIAYLTTASLSLFSPPKLVDERKRTSTLKIHKYLAIVHMSGMIITNVLAHETQHNASLKPWHRTAAISTFAAFLAANIVIKF